MKEKFTPPTPAQQSYVTPVTYPGPDLQFSPVNLAGISTSWNSPVQITEIDAKVSQGNTSYVSKAIVEDTCLKNGSDNFHKKTVVIGLSSPASSTPLKHDLSSPASSSPASSTPLKHGLSSPASSTPLKQNLKNGRIGKPKLKKHRPKIFDDSRTLESIYRLKTTPKNSIPKPKRSYVRKSSSKLPDSSKEVETADNSCRRALNFDLENKAEDGREDDCKQALKLCSGENEDIPLVGKYQWKNKQKGHVIVDTSAPAVQKSMVRTVIDFDSWLEAKGEIQANAKATEVGQRDGNDKEKITFVPPTEKVSPNKLSSELETSEPQNEELGVETVSPMDGQTSVAIESQDLYSSIKLKRREWLGQRKMPLQHLISKEQCSDNEEQIAGKSLELSNKEKVTRKRLKQHDENHTPQCTSIVSYKGTPDYQYKATIDIDVESVRVSDMLMINCGGTYDEGDSEKEYWARERSIIRKRVESFVSTVSVVQGDRKYSPWEGSVVDSVVGAFLTQNVSDHFSSSAFMELAAQYPAKNINGRLIALEETPSNHCASIRNDKLSPGGKGNYRSKNVLKKDGKEKKKEENKIFWEKLRKYYSSGKPIDNKIMDAVDWEAVRRASADEVANSIKSRGMNNVLAKRIQEFLDSVSENHGSIDLEWLRDVPPQDVKDFLLSIFGMGLKSVECIRLLTLQHVAFPVDTNVGRIAVRLGWVPLKPLPDGLELHLLETYPPVNSIQKYLYPRLCTIDPELLYELHYHMITFGKVYCTKQKPNCSSCPMKKECKHFASASASERLALASASENKNTATAPVKATPLAVEKLDASASKYQSQYCEPIVELVSEEESELEANDKLLGLEDIEDLFKDTGGSMSFMDSDEDILTIRLDSKSRKEYILDNAKGNNISIETGTSEAWAVVASPAPLPRKFESRERTVHQVYVLPPSHPILEAVDRRDLYDPSPYLFAVWEEGLVSGTQGRRLLTQTSEDCSRSPMLDICCESEEHSSETISGTLLIPVRTANRGSFPLNGTYFQVNEVFADDESTQRPIVVTKKWLSDLPKKNLYCGTSATTTFKGLSVEHMQHAFHCGYFCNRGFDRKTGLPTSLGERFHVNATKRRGRKIKVSSAKQ